MSSTTTVNNQHPTSIEFILNPLNLVAMDTIQLMRAVNESCCEREYTYSIFLSECFVTEECSFSKSEYTCNNECTDIRCIIIQESFNVLDCGIYRVISRRGSQSDEETGSLINHSTSEEERLKEFSFVQEEDQVDQGKRHQLTINKNKNDCSLKT